MDELTTTVDVPDLVGLTVSEAWQACRAVALALSTTHPMPQVLARYVLGQQPRAGLEVPAGSVVLVSIDPGGGGAGVREPRRPLVPLRSVAAAADQEQNAQDDP